MMGSRFVAAAFVVAGLAGPAQAEGQGETLIRQLLLDIDLRPDWSASVAALRSDGDWTIAEGLALRGAEGEPTILIRRLAADGLKLLPGGGFAADGALLEGVSVRFEEGTTEIPLIEASRLALPDMSGVSFDPERPFTFVASLYSALAEAEAERIAVPEISQTQQATADGAKVQVALRYSDLALEGWSGGVIQSWSAGPMVVETLTDDSPTRFEVASAEARRINIATIAHVFDPARYRDGRGDRVWRPATESVRYGGIRITGEDATVLSIGEIGMAGLDMRQAGRPFVTAAELMLAEPDMDPEEGIAWAREFLPGILHAFRLGELWIDDFALTSPDEVDVRLRRFAVAGLSADGIDRIGLDGFRVAAPDADLSLGAFELAGLVFPELEALLRAAELGEAEDQALAQQELAGLAPSLMPRLARLLIDGVSVAAEGLEPITLESYLVELDRYVGAVPSIARSKLTGLSIPAAVLALDPETAAFFQGLDALTFDFFVDSDYAAAEGRVRSAALLAARELMSVRLEAELIGLTDNWITRYTALASGVPEEVLALLADLRLASLIIEVRDQAMVNRGFGFAAMQQGRQDAAAFRDEIKAAVPFMLMFVSDPFLRSDVGHALAYFLEGGHRMTLRLEPPSPVSLADIIVTLEDDPESLPGLLGAKINSGE